MKKNYFQNTVAMIFCMFLFFAASGAAYGANASLGLAGCGGNYLKDPITNETVETAYVFRNFNTDETIMIDRLIVFNGNGVKLFDGLPGGFFKSTLGPMQSTIFPIKMILTSFLPPEARPLQTYVLWHTDKGHPAESLKVSTVVEIVDSATGERNSMLRAGCVELDYKDSYNF